MPLPQFMEGTHEGRAASVYDSCNADHDPHIMFPKACRYKWQRQSRTDAVEHPVHCKFSQLKPQLFADRGVKDTGTVVDESQSRPLQDTAARKDEPGVVQSVFLLFHCYFCPSPAFFFSAYRRYPAVRPENFRPHIHPVPSPSLTLMAGAWPLRTC